MTKSRQNRRSLEDSYIDLYYRAGGKGVEAEQLREHNKHLTMTLDKLLSVADTYNENHKRIFIGIFPTYMVNAQAIRVALGFLVLVHSGLLSFAAKTATIVGKIVPAADPTPPEIDIKEARKEFQAISLSFLSGLPSDVHLSAPQEPRRWLSEFLYSSLVDFVIAHELAHIICGHFDGCDTSEAEDKVNPLDFPRTSWQQEMEADLIAMRMIQNLYGDQVREELKYLGSVLFFGLIESMSATANRLHKRGKAPDFRSHPPAIARRSAMISDTHQHGFLARLPEVEMLVETLKSLGIEK